jgi:hypothetical protein
LSDFAAAGARVLVVSFVRSAEEAEEWLEEAGVRGRVAFAFEPPSGAAGDGTAEGGEGGVYASYGLDRSIAGTWGPSSVGFYADAVASGRPLASSHGHDVLLMGGDFVVARDGTVALAFYSETSMDRPGVDELLEACRRVKEGEVITGGQQQQQQQQQSSTAAAQAHAPEPPAPEPGVLLSPRLVQARNVISLPRTALVAVVGAAVLAGAVYAAWRVFGAPRRRGDQRRGGDL